MHEEIARHAASIHGHLDRELRKKVYPKKIRRTYDPIYPNQHPMMPYGGIQPGYGGHNAAYMNPYLGGHHGGYGGGYGHPGYGGGMPYGGGQYGGYAPNMMPYDPRAFPQYAGGSPRKSKTALDPGHRFSSPQHSQKTGKGSDFRF